MHIIGYIMSSIFRMYMFSIVDVDCFLYTLGQSWQSLTSTKIYMHYIVEWREYVGCCQMSILLDCLICVTIVVPPQDNAIHR